MKDLSFTKRATKEVAFISQRNRNRQICSVSLLISIGLILHFVEAIIPINYIVPGAKLGLSNIVSLLGLMIFGFKIGFIIVISRILLGSLLIGTFLSFNFFMSLNGGMIAYFLMSIVFYLTEDKFTAVGISIIGAVFHNLTQLMTAVLIIENISLLYYLPYLSLFGVASGLGTGLIVNFVYSYLKNTGKTFDKKTRDSILLLD